MTSLYLVRHGETILNSKGVYCGWTDCDISDAGKLQCINLQWKLKDVKFDIVISSPLKRAVSSAKIISGIKEKDILLYDGLKEINFGKWEKMNYKEIEKKYPDEWKKWAYDWKNSNPPEGENFMEFYNRVAKTLKDILDKYSNKKVLIVSHEGTLKVIALALLNIGFDSYWSFCFKQGSYSLFEIYDNLCVIKEINC